MGDFAPPKVILYDLNKGGDSMPTTMDMNDILTRITPILEDTFADTDCEFSLATTREDIEEWDSLAQVRLFLAIEMDFGFKFDLEDMENIEGITDLVQIIHGKID